MHRRALRAAPVLILSFLAVTTASADGLGWKGWGPRAGISSDPDQFVGGVQFDLGEFARRLRFQPSIEIGLGDDTTTIQGNLMVAYYFPVEASVTPYAGGSLSAAFYDFDSDCRGFGVSQSGGRGCDDSETEIGPVGVGGIEMKMKGKARFFAELNLGFADIAEAKIVAGWLF